MGTCKQAGAPSQSQGRIWLVERVGPQDCLYLAGQHSWISNEFARFLPELNFFCTVRAGWPVQVGQWRLRSDVWAWLSGLLTSKKWRFTGGWRRTRNSGWSRAKKDRCRRGRDGEREQGGDGLFWECFRHIVNDRKGTDDGSRSRSGN